MMSLSDDTQADVIEALNSFNSTSRRYYPRTTSYGVYISQLIRFARVSSHLADFNARNRSLVLPIHLLDNSFIRFRNKLHRQIVGIPIGTNCAPLVADLFLFCYERDFMMSLSDDTQADVIEALNSFNSTSRRYYPRTTSYGVYISQLIRFARVSSHLADFNARNRSLTAKLLHQGYRYHKLRKAFFQILS